MKKAFRLEGFEGERILKQRKSWREGPAIVAPKARAMVPIQRRENQSSLC